MRFILSISYFGVCEQELIPNQLLQHQKLLLQPAPKDTPHEEYSEVSESESSEIGTVICNDLLALSEANDDLDITSSVNINFVCRCIPHVNKLKLEKYNDVGYFDYAKTKLHVGKIKSIEPEKTIEFMEQQPNNKFVWKTKPKSEAVSSEQIKYDSYAPTAVN